MPGLACVHVRHFWVADPHRFARREGPPAVAVPSVPRGAQVEECALQVRVSAPACVRPCLLCVAHRLTSAETRPATEPTKIPASASRLAHTPAPTPPVPDRPPSASPPFDFPFELPSPADTFFHPSLQQALSSTASLHSNSTSPPPFPRAQSSQSSFADPG